MKYEKRVDESWKESVAMEKNLKKSSPEIISPLITPQQESPRPVSPARESSEKTENLSINFMNYISSLAFQVMMFLGELPNPMAEDRIEKNLDQAKLLIDTLILIREKTHGNLTKEEDDFLNGAIYELQMKYVENSNSPDAGES